MRVTDGGHNIDREVIERRYKRGINNLFSIYWTMVDGLIIFDNSSGTPEWIVQKLFDGLTIIIDNKKFDILTHYYESHR